MGIQPTNVVVMMTIADYTANLERKKDLVAETKSFLYDEFTIEVQQMIKKKTHSLSPCKI